MLNPMKNDNPNSNWVSLERRLIYLSRREADLEMVRKALAESNFASIREFAHKVKGNALLFGFEELGMIGADLENAAVAKEFESVRNLVEAFETVLARYIVQTRRA